MKRGFNLGAKHVELQIRLVDHAAFPCHETNVYRMNEICET